MATDANMASDAVRAKMLSAGDEKLAALVRIFCCSRTNAIWRYLLICNCLRLSAYRSVS